MKWIRPFALAVPSFIGMMATGGSVFVAATTESLAQTLPTDYPMGFVCWNERLEGWGVAYLATVKKDGTATYMNLNGQLSATVNAEGLVEPPLDRPYFGDCYGKMIDELRSMGRVIEMQHAG